MTARRQIHLGAVPYGTGGPGSHTLWLDPDIPGDASVDIDWFIQTAPARRARQVRPRLHRRQPVHHAVLPAPLPQPARAADPASARSPTQTRHIGLVGTATTSFNSPFNLVRRFGSLDLISRGRAGWNVVTTGDAGTAGNYGLDEHYDYDTRYGRAQEYVELARALWDSYEDDAFLRDRESGVFLDREQAARARPRGRVLQGPRPAQPRALARRATR